MTDQTNLNSDQPIFSAADDKLGRSRFAQRIAEIIIKRNDPSSFVISVNGPWGDGKTSVLFMIKEELIKNDVLILDFNPWRFPDEEKLLKHFFMSLASKLGVDLRTVKEKVGEWFNKKKKVVGALPTPVVKMSDVAEGIATLLQEAEVEVLKQRIESQLKEKNLKIVILMDDLDRLDIDEIQAVFRLIKLSASFPHTTYILSFDDKRVAQALNRKYGNTEDAGRNFLEKIVQVPLSLPPASSRVLMKLTIDGINAAMKLANIESNDEENNRFSEFFDKAFRSLIKTPRLSKRFTNLLTFSLPLMKGEVNHLDLVFIEAIKTFSLPLYLALRDSGELILNFLAREEHLVKKNAASKEELTEIFRKSLIEVPNHVRPGIDALLQDLLPGISQLNIFSQSYSTLSEGNRIKEKRFSTSEYYRRYFFYGLQPDEISDNKINHLIQEGIKLGFPELKEELEDLFGDNASQLEVVINKLRQFEDNLDSNTSWKLATGVSDLSDKFPSVHPDDSLHFFGPRYQAARLIFHLMENVNEDEKNEEWKDIVDFTPSLMFSYELARMIRASSERIESADNMWVVVCEGFEREVNKTVATRIASQANSSTLEAFDFLNAQDLYLFWFFHDAVSLSEYVHNRTAEGQEAILTFLAGLLRVNINPNIKVEYYIQRSFSWFGVIKTLIDPKIIYRSLCKLFPGLDTNEQTTDPRKRIAIAFAKAYKGIE